MSIFSINNYTSDFLCSNFSISIYKCVFSLSTLDIECNGKPMCGYSLAFSFFSNNNDKSFLIISTVGCTYKCVIRCEWNEQKCGPMARVWCEWVREWTNERTMDVECIDTQIFINNKNVWSGRRLSRAPQHDTKYQIIELYRNRYVQKLHCKLLKNQK